MQESNRAQRSKSTGDLWTFALVACALMLAGCGQDRKYEPFGQISVTTDRKLDAMEIAEDVLARMHFAIEKADLESGYIKTRPLPGAQFFEFWRSDNIGADNYVQTNLHTIRRTAELDISQRGREMRITCEVQVQKLSLPEHEITGTAGAYELFSRSRPSLQKLRLHPEQRRDMAWMDLGRDELLETEILRQVEERVLKGGPSVVPRSSDESQATGNEI